MKLEKLERNIIILAVALMIVGVLGFMFCVYTISKSVEYMRQHGGIKSQVEALWSGTSK